MAQSSNNSAELPTHVTFSNGQIMPTIGLGTYQLTDEERHPDVMYKAIVESGYRFLDCATKYANEELVGQAIQRAITDGSVQRKDLFVVTKLWMTDFKDPEAALRKSLAKLQVDQVDCYLIHWPAGFFDSDPANRVPIHKIWGVLESLVDQGLTKSIGVSNFNLQMVADLLCYCRHKPVVNEIELNPTCTQSDLVAFLKAQNIVAIAYTPVCRLGDVSNDALWADGRLEQMCAKYNKSKAQVMLNWAIARGTVPIPRSGSSAHIAENIAIYDFQLTSEDMHILDSLDTCLRICDKRPFTGDFNFFV